jgi:hypothetical protein
VPTVAGAAFLHDFAVFQFLDSLCDEHLHGWSNPSMGAVRTGRPGG